MTRYSIEPRIRKHVKEYGFLAFSRKHKKQLLDTRLDSSKNCVQKVVHETSDFLENKIAGAVTNSHNDKIVKTKTVEEIIIPAEKREKY